MKWCGAKVLDSHKSRSTRREVKKKEIKRVQFRRDKVIKLESNLVEVFFPKFDGHMYASFYIDLQHLIIEYLQHVGYR